MPEESTRLDRMDARFDRVEGRLDSLERKVDRLTGDVQRLNVLYEEQSHQIRVIAEVQTHHGELLEQVVRDIEPLKGLRPLLEQVARDHERRITRLESRVGPDPG